jgi:hypothetical protein
MTPVLADLPPGPRRTGQTPGSMTSSASSPAAVSSYITRGGVSL